MTALLLDGKALATELRGVLAQRVAARAAASKPAPGLATVLVGEDPASQVYVRGKHKACREVGITPIGYELPASMSQDELLALIAELNGRADVHGILVQLPLPAHLDAAAVQSAVALEKDVDCLHPANLGLLAQRDRQPRFTPCTPAGILRLIEKSGLDLSGANAVVLGRSNIVGMPVALLLTRANATVTIAHSHTRDLPTLCRSADLLVAAVGRPQLVRGDWVREGAVVIDVGVNQIQDPAARRGRRLVGDVAFDEIVEKAAAITPVPGGVGPMTIAMLLENTLKAAELAAA
ncbi:MAG: bifunctional methylenetetrahydrofolate dehydrogenase/methenyltetrahydrofolate cyclohydrolase FolD [Anaerolineales bacterium]|nr:bifunctional methylenetetrahydrofolate dehydrogenase/methenyltetrahydrofolate cyclohydrolase FolD [Anaerolineales bacterium]MCW5855826.1 bifunctional methylenetetrahydrofolate dehydrogenase/methenyltetrahydrofolate cyclohydrolase FolD [Anaerolineales bacterium]